MSQRESADYSLVQICVEQSDVCPTSDEAYNHRPEIQSAWSEENHFMAEAENSFVEDFSHVMVSGEHFGMEDLAMFNEQLSEAVQRVQGLSMNIDESRGSEIVALMDEIEEEIEIIFEEFEDLTTSFTASALSESQVCCT